MLPGKLKPPHPQPLSHGERGVKVTMSYYDSLETRDPAEREQDLMGKLARQLVHAREHSPYYGRWLADCDLSSITSREALAALPLTRKRDLIELRKQHPPFGGLNALSHRHARRVFASPGPIYELQGQDVDPWRMAFGDPA
jgi:phenylacetate-CoA ligase